MKQTIILLAIILAFSFSSCEKEPKNIPLTDEMARDTLYDIMNYWYFWYDKIPEIDKNNYINPSHLLNAMVYDELDKWSFVTDYETFMAEMGGEFYGHGISIGIDDNDIARIVMIYSNSPLYAEGVRRGWTVKSINGYNIAEIIKNRDSVTYSYLFGLSSLTFLFEKPDGTVIEITSSKSHFTVNTVLHSDTLHLKSGITGHLVLESFKASTSAELVSAINFFGNAGVTSLIVDLRYNSGGYLTIAQELGSYIAGNSVADQVFATLQYSDKRERANKANYFMETSIPLDLSEVVIITSRSTASASEAVINGLDPFVNVVQIGDTTYGKPMGMDGWYLGEKYVFYPVTFKLVNSEGTGEYFDGIVPEIIAGDDIEHDFNDRDETCLNEAINYLETGIIKSGKGEKIYRPDYIFEKPGWSNNLFGQISHQ